MPVSLTASELRAVAETLDALETATTSLSGVEAYFERIEIKSEVEPGILGWIERNNNGFLVFTPADEPVRTRHNGSPLHTEEQMHLAAKIATEITSKEPMSTDRRYVLAGIIGTADEKAHDDASVEQNRRARLISADFFRAMPGASKADFVLIGMDEAAGLLSDSDTTPTVGWTW